MIPLDKILIIINSDFSGSQDVADYYIAKRGLNPAHQLVYSLGTGDYVAGTDASTADVFYSNVIRPVADYIDNNNIKCIILSAGVPIRCTTAPSVTPGSEGISYPMCTGNVLATSRAMRDHGNDEMVKSTTGGYERTFSWDTVTSLAVPIDRSWLRLFELEVTPTAGNQHATMSLYFWNWLDRKDMVAFGRLGRPTDSQSLAPGEHIEEAYSIIDIALEQEGKIEGPIHIGMHDRPPSSNWDLMGLRGEALRRALTSKGIPVKHYIRSYDSEWSLQPPVASYDYNTMIAGNLDPVEPAWGLVGTAITNEEYNAPFTKSYQFLRGCWGYEATSYGNRMMHNILRNGGAAAIGTIFEPFGKHLPLYDMFVNRLTEGMSVAEALLLSRCEGIWQADCWGDPLYRPFKGRITKVDSIKNV